MRWTEKQLHCIPAMCCKLQPATLLIFILRTDGETWPHVETDERVERSKEGRWRVTVRESLIGLLVPAPTSLCGMLCSKVIVGIFWNLTVIVWQWLHANVKPRHTRIHITSSLLHTPTVMHPEWRLGKRLDICLYSQRCKYWDSGLCDTGWFTLIKLPVATILWFMLMIL